MGSKRGRVPIDPDLADWKAQINEADRGTVTALPGGAKPIAPCRPVDVSGLEPALRALLPSAQPEDVVATCEECGAEVWVAPKKRFLGSTGVARLVCYPCGAELAFASGEGVAGIKFHHLSEVDWTPDQGPDQPAHERYPHRLFIPTDNKGG